MCVLDAAMFHLAACYLKPNEEGIMRLHTASKLAEEKGGKGFAAASGSNVEKVNREEGVNRKQEGEQGGREDHRDEVNKKCEKDEGIAVRKDGEGDTVEILA